MSVSDPLLEILKDYARRLLVNNQNGELNSSCVITDENVDLPMFCATIEKILNKGLKQQRLLWNLIEEISPTPWVYLHAVGMNDCPSIPFSYKQAVFRVKDCLKVKTVRGKIRHLIRNCLVQNSLHIPFEYLTKSKKDTFYYSSHSVIGDEVKIQLFLSIVMQVGRLTFNLNLENSSFLDSSWYLPTRNIYQLAPCNVLGLRLTYIDNYGIITDIQPGSVVSEIEDIEVGDILEEINGSLITARSKIRLKTLLKRGVKQQVTISILKAYYQSTGKPFPAMIRLLRDSSIDLQNMHLRRKSIGDGRTVDDPKSDPFDLLTGDSTILDDQQQPHTWEKPGYLVTYVGSVEIGKFGNSELIGPAIDAVVSMKKESTLPRERVIVECQEIGVKVSDGDLSVVKLHHLYMAITACSRSEKNPNYFAYIAGEQPCNLASMFTCYVFCSSNNQHVLEILSNIGQGFKRTQYVV